MKSVYSIWVKHPEWEKEILIDSGIINVEAVLRKLQKCLNDNEVVDILIQKRKLDYDTVESDRPTLRDTLECLEKLNKRHKK
jgi:hypothetical protein